jgi:hypothetical protein
LAIHVLLADGLSPVAAWKSTMNPRSFEQPDSAGQKAKRDWVFIGSLVLIAISLIGMAYICWIRYTPGS